MFKQVGINVSEELYQSFTGQSTINVCKRLKDHFKLTQPADDLKDIKQTNFKHIFKHDDELQLIVQKL